MRKFTSWMFALVAAGLVMTAAPTDADAAFRIGADGLWMPLTFQNIEQDDATLDTDHDLASFGVSAHGNMGFDIFSLGLKINYFNQAIDFEGEENVRYEELDINLMGRLGIPATDFALFAELGPTTSPDFDFFGYNVGGGFEYDILGLPLFDLNLGAMGQYVNVSDVDFSIEGVEETANLNEGRVMFFIGADFSI